MIRRILYLEAPGLVFWSAFTVYFIIGAGVLG